METYVLVYIEDEDEETESFIELAEYDSPDTIANMFWNNEIFPIGENRYKNMNVEYSKVFAVIRIVEE